MNNQTSWAKSAANLCLEFGEEDGIDPRYLTNKSARKTPPYKLLQLCKECSRTVALVLSGEVSQPLLRELQVLSVKPDKHEQTLCVTLAHLSDDKAISADDVVVALQPVQGLLRCALAQALNRKHVPGLRFHYAGKVSEAYQGGGECLSKR